MADSSPDLWSIVWEKLGPFIPGVVGAVFKWIMAPQKDIWGNLGASIVCAGTAYYGTAASGPIITYYFSRSIADQAGLDGLKGLVGLILGVTGYYIIRGVIRLAVRWSDNPQWPPR